VSPQSGFMFSASHQVQTWNMSSAENLLIKSRFLAKLHFMLIIAKTQACSWSLNPDMNVKIVKKFCWDASWTFFNEFGLIEVIARSNHDSPNDRGEGMIIDMPLLYIEQSSFFLIERNDPEEECLKSLFKHDRFQNMTFSPKEMFRKKSAEKCFLSILHFKIWHIL